MHASEKHSTNKTTRIVVKILDSAYAKSDLDKVSVAAVQLDENQRKKLQSLLTDFEEFFNGTLGKWDTTTVKLQGKPGSKMFNTRYYPVPKINKETSLKEIQRLVEIVVLTPIQKW